MGVKFHSKYCSYMGVLYRALKEIDGAVLELGTGFNSTYFLHWVCLEENRFLVSYENDPKYFNMVNHCNNSTHRVCFVDDWDYINIERPWGIALVDHAPAIRRKEEVKRLANYAQCILIHDSQGRSNKHYRYDEVYPLFKYRYNYGKALPQTGILSNFVDVSKWWN